MTEKGAARRSFRCDREPPRGRKARGLKDEWILRASGFATRGARDSCRVFAAAVPRFALCGKAREMAGMGRKA